MSFHYFGMSIKYSNPMKLFVSTWHIDNSIVKSIGVFVLIMSLLSSCEDDSQEYIKPYKHSHIALIGNNLCSRMLNFGHFETELQLRYPDSLLTIRNMCDGGDTPGFRPHSGRNTPWAFPGAEQFQSEYATNSNSEGQFEYPDEWLSRLETDIIIACFGYSESFEGPTGLDIFKEDLDSFVVHTLHQRYNGISPPTLVLVSPIAFEDLSDQFDYPNGVKENANLLIYENAIKEVAKKHSILFIDAFNPSMKWFSSKSNLTIDGSQMNEDGYKLFSTFLADKIFGKKKVDKSFDRSLAHEAVMEKNWFWHNDYKMPNGVHVFGRRYEPFGSDNYPDEIAKIRELTAFRDTAIWAAVKGIKTDLQEKDKSTRTLKSIETNFEIDGTVKYLYDEELMKTLHTAPGYKIEYHRLTSQYLPLSKDQEKALFTLLDEQIIIFGELSILLIIIIKYIPIINSRLTPNVIEVTFNMTETRYIMIKLQ